MTGTTPRVLLGLTDAEYEALRDMVSDWLCEGFNVPPFAPAIQSVLDMLDMESHVPEYLRSRTQVNPGETAQPTEAPREPMGSPNRP